MIYCIECSSIVPPVYEVDMDCHVQFSTQFSGFLCSGPLTYCPPPEIQDGWYGTGWNDNLVAPDDEFMAISDANAESLKLEFENV